MAPIEYHGGKTSHLHLRDMPYANLGCLEESAILAMQRLLISTSTLSIIASIAPTAREPLHPPPPRPPNWIHPDQKQCPAPSASASRSQGARCDTPWFKKQAV